MTPDAVWTLPTRHIGRTIHVHNRLESTNTLGLSLKYDEQNDGLVILAREQTAGRGQHGRAWWSKPNSSVLMSVVLFPPPALRRPVLLTAWAAVAVCEMIREVAGVSPSIKWPNDVLVDGKKICGILIEQREATVAGIGLNVRQSAAELRAAGLVEATSLMAATGRRWSAALVAKHLCRRLDHRYGELCRGELDALQTHWQKGLDLLGRDVAVECHDDALRGVIAGLTFDAVALRSSSSSRQLQPESIRHITAMTERVK